MGRDEQARWADGSYDEVSFGRWPARGGSEPGADPDARRSWTVEGAGGAPVPGTALADTLGGPDATQPAFPRTPPSDVLFTAMAPFDDVFANGAAAMAPPGLRARSSLDEFADWAEDATRSVMRDAEKALAEGERQVESSLGLPEPVKADFEPMALADVDHVGDYAPPNAADPDDVDTTAARRAGSGSPPPPAAELGPAPRRDLGPQLQPPSAADWLEQLSAPGDDASARPSAAPAERPSPQPGGGPARRPAPRPGGSRPGPGPSASRPVAGPSASRPVAGPSASRPVAGPSGRRPAAKPAARGAQSSEAAQREARRRELQEAFRSYTVAHRSDVDPSGRPAPPARRPGVSAATGGGSGSQPNSRRDAQHAARAKQQQQAQAKRGLGIGLFVAFIIIVNIVRSCASSDHDRGSAPTTVQLVGPAAAAVAADAEHAVG